jgi:hypothetical protein
MTVETIAPFGSLLNMKTPLKKSLGSAIGNCAKTPLRSNVPA